MDIYQEIKKDLVLLKLNETQMSEEQLKDYASALSRLRKKIVIEAEQILINFCLSGILIPKSEQPAVINNIYLNIETVLDDEKLKGGMKRLSSILFRTYSLDSFLEAACDLRDKVIYQAYAPYWISKCEKRKVPANWAGIKGEAWYSQILDMFWHEEYHIWVSVTEIAWHTCLPPVIERGK